MAPVPARRTVLTGLGAAAGGAALGAVAGPADAAPARASSRALIGRARRGALHVMSANIRYDRSGSGDTLPGDPDHWPDRRPLLIELLEREQPTLLGIQEALYGQLSAVEAALPRHRSIGYGREGGSGGEHSAIFYDTTRLEVLEWDQFWLSDTPELIGSATWGNTVTRIVVRARMRDLASGTEFAMINTHFDHQSESARIRSAGALIDLLHGGELDGLPAVVTGDFNSSAQDSSAYTTLVEDGPLLDAWEAAEKRLTPAWGTFPAYEDPVEGGDRIDWVLTTDELVTTQAAINVRRDASGAYPSDHAPVQALISLP